jgi:hypothetical protein
MQTMRVFRRIGIFSIVFSIVLIWHNAHHVPRTWVVNVLVKVVSRGRAEAVETVGDVSV